jgi:hypothetical protein
MQPSGKIVLIGYCMGLVRIFVSTPPNAVQLAAKGTVPFLLTQKSGQSLYTMLEGRVCPIILLLAHAVVIAIIYIERRGTHKDVKNNKWASQ